MILIEPESYSHVDLPLIIKGKVTIEELANGKNYLGRLGLEILDPFGKIIYGGSIDVAVEHGKFYKLDEEIDFTASISFPELFLGWLVTSEGRLTFKITALGDEVKIGTKEILLPVIFKDYEPVQNANPEIIEFHENVEKRLQDLARMQENYHKELSDIHAKQEKFFEERKAKINSNESEIEDDKFLDSIFQEVESSLINERHEVDKKYSELIKVTGPLVRGLAGRDRGFEFRVYSNDHGNHFHVIHKERGIDARFNFPELTLESHKSASGNIKSVDLKNIVDFFSKKKNFKKLEMEFYRRGNINPNSK